IVTTRIGRVGWLSRTNLINVCPLGGGIDRSSNSRSQDFSASAMRVSSLLAASQHTLQSSLWLISWARPLRTRLWSSAIKTLIGFESAVDGAVSLSGTAGFQ